MVWIMLLATGGCGMRDRRKGSGAVQETQVAD